MYVFFAGASSKGRRDIGPMKITRRGDYIFVCDKLKCTGYSVDRYGANNYDCKCKDCPLANNSTDCDC